MSMHMYFANAVLTTLVQWSFAVTRSAMGTYKLLITVDQIFSCCDPNPICDFLLWSTATTGLVCN
jgi:hypothetical protein